MYVYTTIAKSIWHVADPNPLTHLQLYTLTHLQIYTSTNFYMKLNTILF